MMKTLKFKHELVQLILDGSKTITWRLFYDKNLKVGYKLELLEYETGKKFAEAEITGVKEKTLGQVDEGDFTRHETYQSRDDMLQHYRGYYGDKVTFDTELKIIEFKLLLH